MARIVKVDVLDNYKVRLAFKDGLKKIVDLEPYLRGPMFEPLKEPKRFKRVRIEGCTISWPNGADLCPDMLHDAPTVAE